MNDVAHDPERLEAGGLRPPPPPHEMPGGDGGDGEGIGLRELVAVLWNGKWIIVAITAVVFALALVYAFLAAPVYEANALIQIEQQSQTSPGASADVLSMLFPIAAPAETEIQIMTSRSVLRPTVKKEDLNIRVDGGGFLSSSKGARAVGVTELQIPDDWKGKALTLVSNGNGRYALESPDGKAVLHGSVGDPASGAGGAVKVVVSKLDLPAGKSVPITRLYDQQAVTALRAHLSVAEQGHDTGIVQVSLKGHSPVLTRNVVNAMANAYMKQNVAAMAAQAQKSLDFVNKQLPQLKHELNAAQTALTGYQSAHGAVALDQQAQAFLQQLTTLEGQLTQLQLTESAMRQRYTSSYPGYKGLQSQQRDIKSQIDAIQGQIKHLPRREQDYLSLLQNVQVHQQLYTALLAKAQDLQVTAASTVGSARIVDYAVTPIVPVKPRKSLIAVLGFIIGLILGVLAVFLRRALHRGIEDSAALEQAFGLPVYAVVPHSGRQRYFMRKAGKNPLRQISILAQEEPHDPAVESIRSLRTSLGLVLQRAHGNMIAISGCTPAAGKSFLSVNLAHVLATSGMQTLLIDADLRRGYLERYIGVPKQPGLAQFLAGSADLGEVVVRSPTHERIHFIPSGPYPANPYELLLASNAKEHFLHLSNDYDAVVFDVPPILSVADGILLGQIAAVNLMVIRAGQVTLPEVRIALDRMQQSGIRLDGFIFNGLTRQAANYTYGRYAKSYYDYAKPGKGGK